jgi:periplasmic protein TonB
MDNATVYDQLDMASGAMLANPEFTSCKPGAGDRDWGMSEDDELAGLLQIASELCNLPRPDFKTRLKTELEWVAAARPLTSATRPQAVAESQILPSLFGLGSGTYPVRRINFMASLAMHAVAIVLVGAVGMMAFKMEPRKMAVTELSIPLVSDYLPTVGTHEPQGGGGGGAAEKTKASKGTLPKVSTEQMAPPTVHSPTQQAKITVEPTIVAPNLQVAHSDQLGDPLSKLMTPSNGTGVSGGIGSNSGGGVGAGRGNGYGPGEGGGYGEGVFDLGNGVIAPVVIYDPIPEYSPEARAAKYQGTVVLWAIIDADGHPRNLRVQRSLGMGLDEKAMEAVRTWRFRPATLDGHAVAVRVEVEVNFHLY